ncbi:MAG: hypothetical protein MJZ23_08675 [Paludibacteraceae bacterium]|nr:hypothetical protein [Paludibacteraceae bacterium]
MDAQQIINLVTKNASAIQALTSSDSKIDAVIKLIKANSSNTGLAGAIGALGSLFGGKKNTDISALVTTALTMLKGQDLNSSNIANLVSTALKGNANANTALTTIINMIKK